MRIHPIRDLGVNFNSILCICQKNIPHAITTTTTVLTAVARFELTPSIPIFANIEVSAAKIADNNANTNHIQLILSVDTLRPLKIFLDDPTPFSPFFID